MSNIAALLMSPPDRHSNLTGRDLVQNKVKLVAAMGGKYPSSYTAPLPEWNFGGGGILATCDGLETRCAPASANYSVEHMPRSVKMVFLGYNEGKKILSGGKMTTCLGEDNPCRRAFIDRQGPHHPRYSWDPATVLYAILGAEKTFLEEQGVGGYNVIDKRTGNNRWVMGDGGSNQSYLELNGEGAAIRVGNMIDDLLCQGRRKNDSSSSRINKTMRIDSKVRRRRASSSRATTTTSSAAVINEL